jgi:predicted SAM-dependent methyltransferase
MGKFLNIGCGNRFHPDFINMDIVSNHPAVVAHNILKGIPFKDNSLGLVYHSHVLEHFDKIKGEWFVRECFRVIEGNGFIRIAVPDLEKIARKYLSLLDKLSADPTLPGYDYDWILLELYDQTMRNKRGGEMLQYFGQEEIPNEDFIYAQVGNEARNVRNQIMQKAPESLKSKIRTSLDLFMLKIPAYQKYKVGKFRQEGEVHYRMYDRYSLSMLLKKVGFINVKVTTAFESNINNWKDFNLDSENGLVLKPDSLFIEAQKPGSR